MKQTFSDLTNRIDELLDAKPKVLIALDGRCASGKTTLAEKLRAHYGCTVIHLDDFFLRPEQRTLERLTEPGGNVDWERFQTEVLRPLCAGRPFTYRPFDCHTQFFAPPVKIEPQRLTVVEGSYSCHPALRDSYDLRIFLTVDPQTQQERLRVRCPEKFQTFLTRWIPLEEAYFSACGVEQACDLTISTAQSDTDI